jgi:hypothetical protein
VFARGDGGHRHLSVRLRDRDVDDQLDVGMSEHSVGRAPLGPVLVRLRLGTVWVEIADHDHLDVGALHQVGDVLLADHPCTDDTDAHGA